MKLQLWLNNRLFNETHLPDDVFDRIDNCEITPQQEVDYRKFIVDAHAADLKGLFWDKICKTKDWEIVLSISGENGKYEKRSQYYQLQVM